MNYENRFICFIDILGFKAAIEESVTQERVREYLHKNVHSLEPGSIRNQIYGDIPVITNQSNGASTSARSVMKDGDLTSLFDQFPLNITHFSDSFVLSCPFDNPGSVALLLKATYLIHLMYYYNLGMMVRGGIAIGSLIHEENGALFGPALNEAYELESKFAIYPRVLITPSAYREISTILTREHPAMSPIKNSFDGYKAFDLISIFIWPEGKDVKVEEIDKRLLEIEDYIKNTNLKAHPKIAYLLDQWEKYKEQHNKPFNSGPKNGPGTPASPSPH